MAKEVDIKSVDSEIKDPWYQAAKAAAVVAGVFVVIILGLLVVNHLQIKLLDPIRAERLENMKIKRDTVITNTFPFIKPNFPVGCLPNASVSPAALVVFSKFHHQQWVLEIAYNP